MPGIIGWLTVEKDRKVDLEALQIRDVNLNLSSKSEPEPSNPNNESEGNIVNSNASLTFGVDNQEVIMIEDDVMEDSALHEAENMKMSVVNDADPGCLQPMLEAVPDHASVLQHPGASPTKDPGSA